MITDDSVAIVVMAKAPQPGQVKTRLVPPLSAGGAAVLAARFARRTLTTAVAAALGPVTLCCAPDATHEFFQVCARRHGVALVDQGDGDLGARMQRALAMGLERHRRVLLLGTDVPSVEPHDLRSAAAALGDGADVVIGPATDGGYWLIGARRIDASLFDGIAWSTPGVLAATRGRIAALGWKAAEIATHADVDLPSDLEGLWATPATAALLDGLVGPS